MTAFEPAAIPSGVIDVGGNKYMPDVRGALVPLELIKPADKLQDETVRKVLGHALALSQQVMRFKAHTMADLAGLDALLEQQYGLVKRGNKGKGNRTYISLDGLFKVTVQVNDFIAFGPQLQVAKSLLDECLTEWAENSRAEIRALVTRAFNTDREGQINRAAIFLLLGLESEDERWVRAMSAIQDAIRVVGRREYVRFGMRSSREADWTSITIDLAQA